MITNKWEEARIEEIHTGRIKDNLCISNRKPNLWILSLFNGYIQLGVVKVYKGHKFNERDEVLIKRKKQIRNVLGFKLKTLEISQVKKDDNETQNRKQD